MSWLFIISLIGQPGFQAQLGYEPTLMGKSFITDTPEVIAFPYGGFYFNNRITGKVGVMFGRGWEARATGGFAQSVYPDGILMVSIPRAAYPEAYEHTRWNSLELAAGLEAGKALRFRTGVGDIYMGIEGITGVFKGKGDVILYEYTDSVRIETAHMSVNGMGLQGYLGMSYPLFTFEKFAVNFNALLKTGSLILEPDEIPEGSSWRGYTFTESGNLPRWGISMGLNMTFNSGKRFDLDALVDARMKPKIHDHLIAPPDSGLACCCIGGMCLHSIYFSDRFAQASTAFLAGPGISIPFAVFFATAQFDNPASYRIYPLAIGCYLWSPIGSVLGTMFGGRMFNPGGRWGYTILGATIGNLANLMLCEGVRIVAGQNPWRYGPFGQPNYGGDWEWPEVLIVAGSTLPTAGALIGYNLSLKHAKEAWPEQDDMGGVRSWDEICNQTTAYEWNSHTPSQVKLPLVRMSF